MSLPDRIRIAINAAKASGLRPTLVRIPDTMHNTFMRSAGMRQFMLDPKYRELDPPMIPELVHGVEFKIAGSSFELQCIDALGVEVSYPIE